MLLHLFPLAFSTSGDCRSVALRFTYIAFLCKFVISFVYLHIEPVDRNEEDTNQIGHDM